MSGRQEKERRRKRKLEANKFSDYLDTMEVKNWLAHKQNNPHVKCNSEFQEKIEKGKKCQGE